MNKQQLLELVENIKIREGLIKNVSNAQEVLINAQMNLSVEMNRVAGARFKAHQLSEKINNQRRSATDKQIRELEAWIDLSEVEIDKEIDICFAENDLAKAKEELNDFEEELLSKYEVVGGDKENFSDEITPIEEMIDEAEDYGEAEKKKIESIKKSFETFFID